MKCLEYYVAGSVKDALAFMEKHSGAVMAIAGGTDLVVKARRKSWYEKKRLVDISRIKELKYICEEAQNIHIGAGTSISELINSGLIREKAALLWEASRNIAGPQIRNAATIGGNLANACLAGDTIPALCALRAKLKVESASGERWVDASELMKACPACLKHEELSVAACFYAYPAGKKTVLTDQELITEICFPVMDAAYATRFIKVGEKRMGCMSRFTLAAALKMKDGCIEDIRLAYGSVFADIKEQIEAEKKLIGLGVKDKDAMKAAVNEIAEAILAQQKNPDENLCYRAEVCRRLTVRTLEEMMCNE